MTKKIFRWFLVGVFLCFISVIYYGLFGRVYLPDSCEVYKDEPKIDGIKFTEFDKAHKVVVVPGGGLKLEPIIITDPEKIKLAQETIQRYPDGWVEFHYTKWNLMEVTAAPPIEFYDVNDHLLDYYEIRQDILVYRSNGQIYWRCVGVKELQPLIEALNIPDEILNY